MYRVSRISETPPWLSAWASVLDGIPPPYPIICEFDIYLSELPFRSREPPVFILVAGSLHTPCKFPHLYQSLRL